MNEPRARSNGTKVFELLELLLRLENLQLALQLGLLGTEPSCHAGPSLPSRFAIVQLDEATKSLEERLPVLVRDGRRVTRNLDGLVPHTRTPASTRVQAKACSRDSADIPHLTPPILTCQGDGLPPSPVKPRCGWDRNGKSKQRYPNRHPGFQTTAFKTSESE